MFDEPAPVRLLAAAAKAQPGPEVIQALLDVDLQRLSEASRVDYLLAWERQAAWVASWSATAVRGVVEGVRGLERRSPSHDGEMGERSARCEVATAARVSEHVAGQRVATADALAGHLSAVAEALRAGDISYGHAEAIADATGGLSELQARQVAERVLDRARRQTVAQLRASLRRAVCRVAPELARRNAKAARGDQDVDWWPLCDGQAELRLRADAADILAVAEAVRAVAAQLGLADKAAGIERTAGQRRAAALVALVIGDPAVSRKQAVVNVTLDLPTLLGLQDQPGELAGYGPIPAPIARELAADGGWRRLIHEPIKGHLLDLGTIRYRPSAALAAHVRARSMSCIFPGCNRRAAHCDLDHTIPYKPDGSGGATDRHNSNPLCRHHHRVKHATGWTLRSQGTDPPVWISPTGRRYPVEHHDYSAERSDDPTNDDFTGDEFESLTDLRGYIEDLESQLSGPVPAQSPPPDCPF